MSIQVVSDEHGIDPTGEVRYLNTGMEDTIMQ